MLSTTAVAVAEPEQRSAGSGAWNRFKRHKPSIIGLVIIALLVLAALLAPVLAPADPNMQELTTKPFPAGTPFPEALGGKGIYLLGSDHLGRDLLSRLLYGARISLLVGFVAQALVLLLGVPLGAIAGYYGGKVDQWIMRVADLMFAFPELLFAMTIMFALGPGLINLYIALGFVSWAGMARLVRGQVLQLKERDFVESAKAAGAKDWRIIMKHILPNALGPIIVSVTLGIPGAIMSEAALSFLGLGVRPPTATWGSMIYEGRAWLKHAPSMSILPGLAIMITVLAFNLVGDGLRDALDPKANRKM